MKTAAVSKLKASLSEYLSKVKAGRRCLLQIEASLLPK